MDYTIKNDLISIAEYIARDSLKYAIIQIKRIRERVRHLKKVSKSGRDVPEYIDKKLKELIIGNYRIIYRIRSANHIDIITVHHSAKRLKL
ncbi:MAG: type II toxin-antitoxin system RelE/ParE family toxin [Bacteroidetes bacterium]|nr:type II toxin-antitoxin system RelE/ParE family toxin [Bacteroidota bacterium]MCH8232811.1 type II toxin-antitoxin system RelE/ParE family toxin [Bacteroidota bacterium]